MKTNTNNTKTNIVFLLTLLLSMNLISTKSISSNLKSKSESLLEEEETFWDRDFSRFLPKGAFFTIVANDGTCMSGKGEGKPIIQEKCGKTDEQLWEMEEYEQKTYVFKNKKGLTIDSSNRRQGIGKPLISNQLSTSKINYQMYRMSWLHDGSFQLNSGRNCIEVGKNQDTFQNCYQHKRNQFFKFKDI